MLWIDVYSPGGGPDQPETRVGSGPIRSVMEWESTARLDAAGSFSFSIPAMDEKATLISQRRVVWAYSVVGEVIVPLGAGVVKKITTTTGNPPMLRVSGPDLLAELAERTVGQQQVNEMDWRWLYYDRGSVRRLSSSDEEDLPEAYDGNILTATSSFNVTDDWFLYVGFDARYDSIRFSFDDTNDTYTTTLQYQYFSKQFGWRDLTSVVDTTIDTGRPFAQDGTITFARPIDWERAAPTEEAGSWFWTRFRRTPAVGDNFAVSLVEVEVYAEIPTTDGVNLIMQHAPSGWAGEYPETITAKYLEFDGESVLTALITLSETGGQAL